MAMSSLHSYHLLQFKKHNPPAQKKEPQQQMATERTQQMATKRTQFHNDTLNRETNLANLDQIAENKKNAFDTFS